MKPLPPPPVSPDLRQRAEALLHARESAVPEVSSPEETTRIIHELRVHQIELEMQNDELHRAQAALNDSRARYFDLYDLAPVGYLTLGESGVILQSNLAAASLFGIARGALINQPMNRFLSKDYQDSYYQPRQPVADSGFAEVSERSCVRPDGSSFWALFQVAPMAGGEYWLTVSDISERKRAEESLKLALAENTVLVQEIHHRVKNNLAIMISLINIQARHFTNPETLTALADTKARLFSMSLLHQMLYQSGLMDRVEINGYLHQLCGHLTQSLGLSARRIHLLHHASTRMVLEINQAVPLGLIVSEFLTNAIKHAFPEGRPGEVAVGMEVASPEVLVLRVSDNGVGLPASLQIEQAESVGLTLINTLTRQLAGTLTIKREHGTQFEIRFPIHPTGDV